MSKLDLPQLSDESILFRERDRLVNWVRAPLTVRGYRQDWGYFAIWCERHERQALPASNETVALYITDMLTQGRKTSTAHRHVSAIVDQHRAAGFESPAESIVPRLIAGCRRERCEMPRQKAPLSVEHLRLLYAVTMPGDMRGARDRGVILLGFATALRRSSIAALDISDLEFTGQGLIVLVRHEKQDRIGTGRHIGVPFGAHQETCAVAAIRSWLVHRGQDAGPLFCGLRYGRVSLKRMHPATIGTLVKRAIERISLDPKPYSSHSMRAGFVTAAGNAGVNELRIAQQTGHRSLHTLRRYFRPGELFRSNACGEIGL